jgi:hypothetical protein
MRAPIVDFDDLEIAPADGFTAAPLPRRLRHVPLAALAKVYNDFQTRASASRVPGRAIAPATSFQHVDDAADDAPVVHPRDASHIRRQMGLVPLPLSIAQSEKVCAKSTIPDESALDEIGIVRPPRRIRRVLTWSMLRDGTPGIPILYESATIRL